MHVEPRWWAQLRPLKSCNNFRSGLLHSFISDYFINHKGRSVRNEKKASYLRATAFLHDPSCSPWTISKKSKKIFSLQKIMSPVWSRP
jgi:hypothetical protein